MTEKTRSPFTKERVQRIADLYFAGHSNAVIAQKEGLAQSTISMRLRQHFAGLAEQGLPIPVREKLTDVPFYVFFPKCDDGRLTELYASGLSVPQIAILFPGQTQNSINGAVKRLGLPPRGKGYRSAVSADEFAAAQKPVAPAMCQAIEDRISELAKRGLGPMLIATHTRQPYRVISETMGRLGLLRAVGA